MTGARTALFLSFLALAVGVVPSTHQQSKLFDFVTLDPTFAVMRHEVTIAQWRKCFDAGECTYMPKNGLGAVDDTFPVTDINWFDVSEFVTWAKTETGLEVRLPTAKEWSRASHLTPRKP